MKPDTWDLFRMLILKYHNLFINKLKAKRGYAEWGVKAIKEFLLENTSEEAYEKLKQINQEIRSLPCYWNIAKCNSILYVAECDHKQRELTEICPNCGRKVKVK